MKIFLLSLITFFSSILIFPQDQIDKIIPLEAKAFERQAALRKVNYPGDASIDVTYYKIDLKFNEADSTIKGNTTVEVKSNNQAMISFFLDLRNTMAVDSVLSFNQRINYTHNNDQLVLTLPHTYNTGEKINVDIFYHGIPAASGFGSFEFSVHDSTHPVIWSLSEPYGAPDWFPCKDTPADKADSSDVWITCSSALKGVSNGSLEQTLVNGDGTTTYKWKNHYPIAQYLISVAMTNYAEYDNTFNYAPGKSMPVVHFIYPERLTNDLKSELDKTVQMLQIFSNRFGLYPFINEKYGHAQFGWGGGMEHQTLTSLGAFGDEIISHELSHQWFGDKITCRDWHHIWLNEGFATYAEGVFFEDAYGKDSYNNYISGIMDRAKNASGSIWVQDITNVGEIFNSSRSYAKGGVVLHMLRGIVGDSTFFRIMKTYAADPSLAYGTAVTEDFQRVAENVYGSSLSYFFQEWIYGENYPKYNVNWNSSENGNGLYNLHLTINQAVNTNPQYFTMPVQLKINTTTGDTLLTVLNNQQNQEFNIVVKGQPNNMQFDPGNWILKDTSTVTGVEQPAVKINTFKLEQNYPNPFNPTTVIRYSVPEIKGAGSTLASLKIYNILGKEIVTLVNKEQTPGEYTVRFSPSDYGLTSGVYFYTLRAGELVQTRKMMYLK